MGDDMMREIVAAGMEEQRNRALEEAARTVLRNPMLHRFCTPDAVADLIRSLKRDPWHRSQAADYAKASAAWFQIEAAP